MKNKTKIVLIVLTLAIVLLAISCNQQKEVIVSFDERIELLCCIGILTPNGGSHQAKFVHPIRKSALEYFEPYKNHKAVNIAEEILNHLFLDSFPAIALSFNNISELNVRMFPPYVCKEIEAGYGNIDVLWDFAKAVKDFYQETSFEKFWENHSDEYKRTSERFREEISQIPLRKTIEDYFGISKPEFMFNIYISFLTPAGFMFGSPEFEEVKIKYSVTSPWPVPPDSASYDHISGKDLISGAIHEFGHSFINPVTAKFQDEVAKRAWLFEVLNKNDMMTNLHYGRWEGCLNENIVRAATARLNKYVSGEKPTEKWEGRNTYPFLLIPFIYEKLVEYEDNRSKFPTYESFFPNIISMLDSLEAFEEIILDFSFNIYEKEGKFYINWISYGSSAQNAGLLVDDKIKKVGKETIESVSEFNKIRQEIMKGRWGRDINIIIERAGKERTIPIVLNESKVIRLRRKTKDN